MGIGFGIRCKNHFTMRVLPMSSRIGVRGEKLMKVYKNNYSVYCDFY